MYYDLGDIYWWPRMKKDITLYVSKCLTFSKIKDKHQRPSGLLQQRNIREWKRERIAMDFITKLLRNGSGHDAIWVIVDRLTKSTHFLPIREDFKMDRKPLEFSVGDHVLLKVSPWNGVVRFGKMGKLAPEYVRPFEIIERISPVAYRLRLPQELNGVDDTFHVSNLKKCLDDPTLQIPLDEIQVDAKLNFVEELVEILEREFKKLQQRHFNKSALTKCHSASSELQVKMDKKALMEQGIMSPIGAGKLAASCCTLVRFPTLKAFEIEECPKKYPTSALASNLPR
ncbi:putative reverse transcriptase domain-containing protein [Tanacetum coccineum]|uniref:Reverse transcriptase domain-containing protein n=1 Tax=Tanacetum coccineum TaxID=301880 RepID=A0ABQ4WNP1_9ASTR